MTVISVCLLFVALACCLPSAQHYDALLEMQAAAVIPYKLSVNKNIRKLNSTDLAQLGQQLFASKVPKSQNATAMALVVYDWSTPRFRVPNFFVTTRTNKTLFSEMLTFTDPRLPNVPAMFGLTNGSKSFILKQFNQQYKRIVDWSSSEAEILFYALMNLPQTSYANGPSLLYRGDGRADDFFCPQFVGAFGISIDTCVAALLIPQNLIEVASFWATTPDVNVTKYYTGGVVFTILPNTQQQTEWNGRNINDLSCNVGNDEYLYPTNSRFLVVSRSCVYNPMVRRRLWSITLMEMPRWRAADHRNWFNDHRNPQSLLASNNTVDYCVD